MNANTSRRPRQEKPAAAVHGTVRVLQPVGSISGPAHTSTGEVAINGKAYFCRCLEHGYQLFSYDARKKQTTVYDLPGDLSGCDCPDGTYRSERPSGCKHAAGLRALVAAGKVPAVSAAVCVHTDEEADALAAAHWYDGPDADEEERWCVANEADAA
jgi:hypothetical protein